MRVRGCDFPEDRYYHADFNVWIKEETPGVLLLGATSFGVAQAVEFVAFLPKADGTRIDAGRAAGLLELSKAMVSVRSPVAGTIIGANQHAVADPSLISSDPYNSGWLIRLAAPDWNPAGLVFGPAISPAFNEAMDLENFTGRDPR
jgi:glycine cleavage system H protein